jgi:hypothetical protein
LATDPNPALRDEMRRAQAVLEPQIRGLHDFIAVSLSDEMRADVNIQIISRERRRGLIASVIANLDAVVTALQALEDDGYPALDPMIVSASLFSELQGEMDDLSAAASVFSTASPATRLSIGLGAPADKPN